MREVRERNVSALKKVLAQHKGKNIVIGTHGTALSQMIHHYDNSYGYDDFLKMVTIMPWVVKMTFNEDGCVGMEKIDLFNPTVRPDYNNPRVDVYPLDELKAYRFVVIFARYQGKWLYARAKSRDTFETAGGHIEENETPLAAAKRELFEETGAVSFHIEPIFDYCVHIPTEYSNGQVFLAQIHELGEMPQYEMAEIKLFDSIPDKLRFPKILPVLYDAVQRHLMMQSNKDEIWDVYDENRNPTGRTHRRGDPLPKGDYHLAVHVWLQNSSGDFLITKRAPNKGYGNMWECTGGAALTGDDSITAAIREVKEETGLDMIPSCGNCLIQEKRADCFYDIWLFRQDFDLSDVVLQEGETIDAKYATVREILKMTANGEFVELSYVDKLFEMAGKDETI